MRRASVFLAIVLGVVLAQAHVVRTQSPSTNTSPSVVQRGGWTSVWDGYVTITPASTPGWSVYRDNAESFHFQVPPLLQHTDHGGWRNTSDGTALSVRVAFGLRDPEFYKTDTVPEPNYIATQTINRVRWTFWTFSGGAGYYCYRDNLAVAVEIYAPESRVHFSDADTAMLKEVVTTFAFDDAWQRLDRRIARLKTGEMIGNRRIKRIVPAAGGVRGGYEDGILGAIEFDGAFTLSGGVLDESATRGNWNGRFGLDVASTALLPRVGPVVYGVPIIGWNDYFQEVQLSSVPPQFDRGLNSVVVDSLLETFLPGGRAPVVTAAFVRPGGAR